MAQDRLSPSQWTAVCEAIAQRCERQAMTAMHYTFLFSQEIDDALAHLPEHCVERGSAIAEQFGYETRRERGKLAHWVSSGQGFSAESGFGSLA